MNCYSCHMQTNILFGDFSSANSSDHEPDDKEVAAVGAVCGFFGWSERPICVDPVYGSRCLQRMDGRGIYNIYF